MVVRIFTMFLPMCLFDFLLINSLLSFIYDLVISRFKDVRFTGIALTFDTRDNPISRADITPSFERIDPTVVVHTDAAALAWCLTIHIRSAVISDDLSFRSKWGIMFSGHPYAGIVRMVTILEPLMSFDYNWFFPKFRH